MAGKFKFFKRHPITLVNQNAQIQTSYPNFELKLTNNRNVYVWEGMLQPTPLSKMYKIKIEYKLGSSPKIYVISPSLKSFDGTTRIPHAYDLNRPCTFLPGCGEWTDQKLIAETVIPWTSLWLFYYEIWFSTGEWLGGGIHPNKGESKKDE